MRRYAAFLRGVSPMNAKMPELKKSFEAAGFEDVKTVLSSGNLVFSSRPRRREVLEEEAVAAMEGTLGRAFPVIVRSVDEIRAILSTDPYARFRVAPGAKRVVTFLRRPPSAQPSLPLEMDGARILCLSGREAYTAYVPNARGPVFMALIEKTFGKDVTTRTWDTLRKVAT